MEDDELITEMQKEEITILILKIIIQCKNTDNKELNARNYKITEKVIEYYKPDMTNAFGMQVPTMMHTRIQWENNKTGSEVKIFRNRY